ncbi:hypothetical protein BLA9940_04452 [Burkholderia aenigmatica]|uniref:DUF3987 domain-containing protein n=1 Tax=Burkholderia aenigmatica TaxID=2015348 RepID=UPI0014541DED|nr:DUF3987 domain-containing protein [Burkholderia aenigmatica]VWC75927.1 hypothetical protein BLA9940_04452 [Burkholderia aenigmatica]
MNAPTYRYGGGLMVPPNFSQQPVAHSRASYSPTTWQAIKHLTPRLFRAANEFRTNYGATYEAIMVNLLGPVSLVAAGNNCICDHNGNPMLLSLLLRLAAPPLSGKSSAYDRFYAPVIEGMKGWKKPWRFDNVTVPAFHRKVRRGSVLIAHSTAEASRYLKSPLSRAFSEWSDFYDGNIPPFDRADDDDSDVANAPDSAIVVSWTSAQTDQSDVWQVKYGQEAMASGYQLRVLMMATNQTAVEGARDRQSDEALLDYDQRIVELAASTCFNLGKMSAKQLPVLEVSPEAEQILRQRQYRFEEMAKGAFDSQYERVFAVRLAANARRIAGCMHVFEGYEGPVTADTMDRAAEIAECFGAHWLAIVCPPKPIPEDEQRAYRLAADLRSRIYWGEPWELTHRESKIIASAPNFGWTRAQMTKALTLICGWGWATAKQPTIKGREVNVIELNPYYFVPRRLADEALI